jgi:hypothetical protein
MYVNIINSYRDIVAICDKDLLGKKFFEEKRQLDIKGILLQRRTKIKRRSKKNN